MFERVTKCANLRDEKRMRKETHDARRVTESPVPREVLTIYKTNMNEFDCTRLYGTSAWLTKAHHSNQNRRRCHDGNRYLKIEKHDTTSHFELKRAGGGWEKRQGGEERRGELVQRAEESKEDGFHSAAARRNSSLVKGAIIQRIAPGPQMAHKLWAFNFAILTGRSDECRGERDS
ncbi:hypothetical protein ALC62_01416 [Cyphomyrmex costatus]|uniref:Uncharacterized protein n=1 Tax=Cyphomyrmex costatus TaxID=456900 RepID=A0A195D425_9HYME|nr:hypothetical protein ALC62_01416 [Cyphomyrmex costatus]